MLTFFLNKTKKNGKIFYSILLKHLVTGVCLNYSIEFQRNIKHYRSYFLIVFVMTHLIYQRAKKMITNAATAIAITRLNQNQPLNLSTRSNA